MEGEKKRSLVLSNSEIQPGKSVRSQGLEIILYGSGIFYMGLPLHPLSHPSFLMQGSRYLQISSFISLGLVSRLLGI